MSKFCSNCGNQMEDQATFCPNCGAANNAAPAPAPAASGNKAAAAAGDFLNKASVAVNGYIKKVQKNPKMLIVPVAVVVAVILAIVLIPMAFKYSGPAGAVNRLIDAQEEGKSNQIKKLAPEEYWEYAEDKLDVDVDDVKEYFEDELKDDIRDNYEDEYGKNYKVTFKKKDQDDVKKSELKKIAEYLKETYDIDKKDVTEAVKLDGELIYKGSEDDDDEDADNLYVVKISGKWYYMYVEISEEYTYVRFPVDSLVSEAASKK